MMEVESGKCASTNTPEHEGIACANLRLACSSVSLHSSVLG